MDLKPLTLSAGYPTQHAPESSLTRAVYFAGSEHEAAVYPRGDLEPGATIEGPAIIEQLDSTTVLWPGQRLDVDRHAQLILGPLQPGGAAS